MKKIKLLFSFAFLLTFAFSCTKEPNAEKNENGAKLELVAAFQSMTKVGELPPGEINNDHNGFKNIGMYIYYTKDYAAGVVTKPYIRNLECTLNGRMLTPVDGQPIYIYDEMTIVAFYPYNKDAPDFTQISDEQAYPISMWDYSQQTYIPYRAQSAINPSVAYKVGLNFIPKQTVKIEVVVVGMNSITNPAVLPNVAPLNAPDGQDRRQSLTDIINYHPNGGGGQNVYQFTSYLWTSSQLDVHHDGNKHFANIITKGDIIFQSDQLTLTATETINFAEDRIFRYGYNVVTGEIFVPTSSSLVYDAPSLIASPSGYQVCDIDLSAYANWTPINLSGQSFDGGGHQITGLKITSLPANGCAGLFGRLQGSASVRNVNLVSPQITIDAGNTSAYVGAFCGMNNYPFVLTPELLAALRQQIIDTLPADVAEPVIEALLADAVLKLLGGTSTISGCKVSNANITLSGKALKAGVFCGINGNTNAPASINNSYATGSITANASSVIYNDTCFVAGFVGANNATIVSCYSTASAAATAYVAPVFPAVTPTVLNRAAGFCLLGSSYVTNNGNVTNCFTVQANTTPSVSQFSNTSWPTWNTYSGKWPVYNNGAIPSWLSMGGYATTTYPTLVWER